MINVFPDDTFLMSIIDRGGIGFCKAKERECKPVMLSLPERECYAQVTKGENKNGTGERDQTIKKAFGGDLGAVSCCSVVSYNYDEVSGSEKGFSNRCIRS